MSSNFVRNSILISILIVGIAGSYFILTDTSGFFGDASASLFGVVHDAIGGTPDTADFDFIETGRLIRNGPGMKMGVWYLVYQKEVGTISSTTPNTQIPGPPEELDFAGDSTCYLEGSRQGICNPGTFREGDYVWVEGKEQTPLVVHVHALRFLGTVTDQQLPQ